MKTNRIYAIMACLCCVASCISLEEDFIPETGKNHTIEVMASVEGFDKFNVGTKAIEDDESKVSELTMIIYDSQGNIVGDKINLSGANSVFMIETQSNNNEPDAIPYIIYGTDRIDILNNQSYLANCTIYMIANCASVLYNDTMDDSEDDPDVDTIEKLKALTLPVTDIEIPTGGFPMVGYQSNVNLSRSRNTNEATTKLDIPMKKLFAKINVSFQINATVIQTPKFQITGWTVSNVPNKVSLVEPEYTETTDELGNTKKVYNQETVCAEGVVLSPTGPSTVLSAGKPTILHSTSLENPDRFQFTFYMPEHIVKPNKTLTYPDNIPNDEKQRYKPHLCKSPKTPTYVTVTGIYTDLHGQIHEVTYSLYLGQNNTDNFEIYRNQQVNNIITIKGITNSHSDNCNENNTDFSNDNISADHRVDVAEKDFSIAIEREALLDSHFEVRPMDVYVGSGKVVLTVDGDWMRMEKSFGGNSDNGGATSPYISDIGVRKYFTTKLVTETLANSGKTMEVTANEENPRIWLYFDENRGVYDKSVEGSSMHRDITLTLDYYPEGSSTKTKSQVYTFRQMNLWRIKSAQRYYDIEYHEEYLYNYASDDNYNKNEDGIKWGLDGLYISTEVKAYETGLSWIGDIIEAFANVDTRYDFYLMRDRTDLGINSLTVSEYSGRSFSEKIINRANAVGGQYTIGALELSEDPRSAVEYCLNKNKRNEDGSVSAATWYLPAIDEMEDIAVGGYSDFSVFQGKLYWSSQPAYQKYDIHYYYVGNWSDAHYSSIYMMDDKSRARATRVEFVEGQLASPLKSGVPSGYSSGLTRAAPFSTPSTSNYDTSNIPESSMYEPGNDSRTIDENRVRCVRNSGPLSELENN